MKIFATIGSLIFLLAPLGYSHQEVKSLTLAADGIEKLEIDCGAGFLRVRGDNSLKSIEVEAEIVLRGRGEERAKEFMQKHVILKLEKRGGKAVLVSKIKEGFSLFSFGSKQINLTATIPNTIDLEVHDGSGEITVSNIKGELTIEDGSGSISIEDIYGNVIIDDGSGKIDVRNVTGNVNIEDGSGEIEVEDVSDDVSIDDNSGSIAVMNVGKNVTLSDGSGSIEVNDVNGNVVIKNDGSGGIRIRNVKGRVIK